MSNLPILVDCTCNGLQHLAAMIRDTHIGRLTNLTPDPIKQDIYSDVLNNLKPEIKKILGSDIEITRNMVKKIIMTIPYNVTEYSAYEYFINNFKYDYSSSCYYLDEHPTILFKTQQLHKCASLILKGFFRQHTSLKILVQYFFDMASLMSTFNLPIKWVTPKGLVVTQQYVKFDTKKIKTIFGSRIIPIQIPTSLINVRSQKFGIMPNIIHSLDATNIVNLIEQLNYDTNILTIHDCFGSHASDISYIQNLVKNGFIKIYLSNDFLTSFHTGCLDTLKTFDSSICTVSDDSTYLLDVKKDIKIKIPEIPQMGTLNLNDIILSTHMVS
jgi:DNA-directed RNA polymerase